MGSGPRVSPFRGVERPRAVVFKPVAKNAEDSGSPSDWKVIAIDPVYDWAEELRHPWSARPKTDRQESRCCRKTTVGRPPFGQHRSFPNIHPVRPARLLPSGKSGRFPRDSHPNTGTCPGKDFRSPGHRFPGTSRASHDPGLSQLAQPPLQPFHPVLPNLHREQGRGHPDRELAQGVSAPRRSCQGCARTQNLIRKPGKQSIPGVPPVWDDTPSRIKTLVASDKAIHVSRFTI